MAPEETAANAPRDDAPIALCPGCVTPVDPVRDYCRTCGATTGRYTPYLPFEGIEWMSCGFAAMWKKLWSPGGLRWHERLGYALFLALFAPALLLSLPSVLLAKWRRQADTDSTGAPPSADSRRSHPPA